MTRTNVMASSRPQTADTAAMKSGSSRARRGLTILPVVLALAVAPVAPALAASSGSATSGYATPAPKPTQKGPASGTSPSKSTKSPANTAPATTSSAPTTSTQPAKASATLPFTGFDLRWTVGAGLLLVGAGGSIMVMQRRQRRDIGR
jgi:hypothetical protein